MQVIRSILHRLSVKSLLRALAESMALASLLFIVIRLCHDMTLGENYWSTHTRAFILTELTLTWVCSLSAVILTPIFIKTVKRVKMSTTAEYSSVAFFASASVLGAIFISHSIDPEKITITKTILPLTLAVLITGVYYSFRRGAERDRCLTMQTITLEKARSEQLDTELRLLRAQYHPHFLFNMLNTIYLQIDEENEAPRHTIECLSEVLRYQLYSPEKPVAISEEIEVMEKFIELCRLRSSRSLILETDISAPPPEAGVHIYPLLLIPLVENAFKHVGGDFRIQISFRSADHGRLMLTVSNSIPQAVLRKQTARSSGLGLDGLRRRLALLYPGNAHSLNVSADVDTFSATLCLEPLTSECT